MAYWADPSRMTDRPELWDVGDAQLRKLTLDDLNRALSGISECTGLSWETFHPWWIKQLPDEAKLRLLDVVHAFEEHPMALVQWANTTVFIARKDGGRRPIQLLFFIFRLQNVWLKNYSS